MLRRLLNPRLLVAVAVALSAAACGETKNPTSPTATSLGGTQAGSSTGATILGLVNSGAGISARTADVTPGMSVTVLGTSIVASVDLSGRFELKGVPPGDVQLRFVARGIDVKLTLPQVREQQQIEISVTVTSAGATLDSDHRTGPDNMNELEGVVSGLSGSCPTLTFMLNGTTVTTTAQTVFKEGGCAQLRNGMKVQVEGLKQANGSVTAVTVEVDVELFELEGVVSGLSGSCPTLTFMLNGTTVTTTAQTVFKEGGCAQLRNGMKVQVEGLKQANGGVTAVTVEVDD